MRIAEIAGREFKGQVRSHELAFVELFWRILSRWVGILLTVSSSAN